ncbi:MAG: hypothetical protein GC190_05230 [Alphaproteobacteria bacterium]|nr:hypothetical protein [Alphaproteobacteria bacterium]
MPESEHHRRPSFWTVMAYDVLLSGSLGAVMAIAAVPYEEVMVLGWHWHWQVAAIAAGFGFILVLAWSRDTDFGSKFARRVKDFYETAELDRAFQMGNEKLNNREAIVHTNVFLVWSFLTMGPVVAGAFAAVTEVSWAREHWPLIVSITIVLVAVSIVLTRRVSMYVAVRTEEWLVGRQAR